MLANSFHAPLNYYSFIGDDHVMFVALAISTLSVFSESMIFAVSF